MAVAARVVILEVAAGADAGAAQEQVRVERVRLEIDRDCLVRTSLNRPRLRVRGVAVEHDVGAAEAPLLRLAHVDGMLSARGAAAGGGGALAIGGGGAAVLHRLRALRNRQ